MATLEGDALKNTLTMFERSRVFIAGQGLGIARRALEEAVRYAKERRQHGKVIAGHQLVAAMLAEWRGVDAANHRPPRRLDDRSRRAG